MAERALDAPNVSDWRSHVTGFWGVCVKPTTLFWITLNTFNSAPGVWFLPPSSSLLLAPHTQPIHASATSVSLLSYTSVGASIPFWSFLKTTASFPCLQVLGLAFSWGMARPDPGPAWDSQPRTCPHFLDPVLHPDSPALLFKCISCWCLQELRINHNSPVLGYLILRNELPFPLCSASSFTCKWSTCPYNLPWFISKTSSAWILILYLNRSCQQCSKYPLLSSMIIGRKQSLSKENKILGFLEANMRAYSSQCWC